MDNNQSSDQNEIVESTPENTPTTPGILERFNFSRRALIIFTAVIVALLGFIIWNIFGGSILPTTPPEVNIWFDTNGEYISGSHTDIELFYENKGRRELTDVELEILFPSGFEFIESVPESRSGNGKNFVLPNLAPGALASVKVSGIFTGSPDEIKSLQAKLYFREDGATAVFSEETSSEFSLRSPDFNLRLIAPTEVQNSQLIEYQAVFKNISDKEAQNLELRATFPNGFHFISSSVAAEEEGKWVIEKLGVGEEMQITIKGTLSGNSGERKEMRMDMGFADGDNFFVAGRASVTTVIQSTPLSVTHKSNSNAGVINEGQSLNYEINYENKGTRGMTNVQIRLTFDGNAYDLASIEAPGAALVGKTLIWNASGQPALAIVQPGQSGKISLSITARDDLTSQKIKNPEIISKITISSTELPEPISGNEEHIKIQSKFSATAQIIGVESGPAKPQVGEESVYRIRVQLIGNVNELSDVIWLGFLNTPAASIPDSSVSVSEGQDFQQNLSSGRLTWKVGSTQAFEVKELQFSVKITPTVADSGQILDLVRTMSASGKDEFVNLNISAGSIQNIRTESVQ